MLSPPFSRNPSVRLALLVARAEETILTRRGSYRPGARLTTGMSRYEPFLFYVARLPLPVRRSVLAIATNSVTAKPARMRRSIDSHFALLFGAGIHAVEDFLDHQAVLAGGFVFARTLADLDEVAHLVFEDVPLPEVSGGHVHHVAVVIGED